MTYEQAYDNHIGLLHSLTQKYYINEIEYADLFQEYAMAMMKAVDNYDESKGEFSTLLTTYVRNKRGNLISGINSTRRNKNTLSLNYEYEMSEKATLGDLIQDTTYASDKVDMLDTIRKIIQAFKRLPRGEMSELYYFYGLNFADIGELFGVSGARVRQINIRNLDKVRDMIGEIV